MCGLVRGYELRLAVLIALLSLSATYNGMAAASDFPKAPSWSASFAGRPFWYWGLYVIHARCPANHVVLLL